MKVFQIGLGYERVDPNYRTLGAYYFNNDFENITVNLSTRIIKEKVSLSGSIGKQRDNLQDQKMSSMKRTVGNVSASVKFSEKINWSIGYSNFTGFINVKPVDRTLLANTQYQYVDTMNFVQVNQSVNSNLSILLLNNDNVSHNLAFGGNYQAASNKQGNNLKLNSVMGGNASYNTCLKKSGFNFGLNLNSNQNSFDLGNSLFLGAGLNASLPVWKKKIIIIC